MSWTYEQTTGKLFNPDMELVGTGYAGGNCGKNPEGKNNPAMQGIPNVGPLPQNTYRRGEVLKQSHLGPFAIPLFPVGPNEMYGRSGFFMHGDTNPSGNASEGCIIQARLVREAFYASNDDLLTVVEELC